MLDINYIRNNQQVVEKACRDKQLGDDVVAKLLKVDEKRRKLIFETGKIRQKINSHANEIKMSLTNGGKPTDEQIEQGKKHKSELKSMEPQLKEVEKKYNSLMLQIPNVPASDVPLGEDESGNVVVKKVGEIPNLGFEPKHHHEIMMDLDMLDVKRAVEIGGFRSYFLKGQAVLLEQALMRYALDLMIKHGFTPMTTPVLVNEEAMWGTGYFPWGKEDHYVTQDGQFLTGTSEVALTAYRQNELLVEKDLPIKMVGISPCFRREVGTHGKDTKGVVRVHQFTKVEQVVYTIADEAKTIKWHEKMLGFSEELLQGLGLPYQVLLMCTGDMGAGQRKKYDIETWFPAQEKYRETHSASYFNDFQSRRLNMKYQAKDGINKYVYTLNNTVAASPRLLAAVIENYQQADGSIKVPEVLEGWV